MYKDATSKEIEEAMESAWMAFHHYKKVSLQDRMQFMNAIADGLENSGDDLIKTAMGETNLPEARLRSERGRTVFQLRQYGLACAKGNWLDVRIDTEDFAAKPPRPDIRKTMVPLGPVIVFGASNFPFAYSTAGGDTACAFAAGCPVIVKAHPAHAKTSEMVAAIITDAADKCGLPQGIFAHLYGGVETGKALVMHHHTKAVGFTGSFTAGKQLFDWANSRKDPIPVFSEMGSTNPVFLLPEKLNNDCKTIASMYAESITQGVGQFCTNPGLIIGIKGNDLEIFKNELTEAIKKVAPQKMLHGGIAGAYEKLKENALNQSGVKQIAATEVENDIIEGKPVVACVSAGEFISSPVLHHEVFGPFSIIIECESEAEMINVVKSFDGQLTATIMGTENELHAHTELLDFIQNICGRFIINGVPTGVAVCLSMQHGGPFPATTDSRFTSVGADGIKRFVRPVAYQNWPDSLLPAELQRANPLKIWRTVDNQLTKE